MWCRLQRVKTISLILASFMLWHFAGLRVYMQTRSIQSQHETERALRAPLEAPASHFDALLGELKDVIKRGAEKTKVAPEKGFATIDKLVELKEKLIVENERNQNYFSQIEGTIKARGLNEQILTRHQEFVHNYQTKYQTLLEDLSGIDSANKEATGLWGKITGKHQSVEWNGVINKALDFLEENAPRPPARNFDPRNLPHRSLKADKLNPPKLTRAEWDKAWSISFADPRDSKASVIDAAPQTSGTGSGASGNEHTSPPHQPRSTAPPTAADLAETIEVKFTPEIRALADSLGKNPVKIYNWVRNNIEFSPTWGSIQGAQLCLETKSCNAFDTTSLLIALLRYSRINSRYQMGTIEVPIDKFMNWAGGFTSAEAAASLFASGGVPSVVRRVNQSGQVVTVRLEHVWVKAFVDYGPSSGAVNIRSDSWVDLDASFKQYNFPVPANLSQFVRLTNAQTFLNQALTPATVNQGTGEVAGMDLALIQSTLQPDEAAVFTYLAGNSAQKSMREVIGGGSIVLRELSLLPGNSPYKVIASGVGFADLPSALRHTLELSVTDLAGNQLLNFTQSLPSLSNARIVLGYVPASEADRQAMAALIPADPQGALPQIIPASFINMKPQLKIDNQVVSTGSAARLGAPQNMQMRFTSPTIQTPVVENSISAGEDFAIALDLQQVSPKSLTNIAERFQQVVNEVNTNPGNPNVSTRELEDLLLASIAFGWFRQVDLLNRVSAQMLGVVTTRYPSAGMAFADLIPGTLFGAVYQVQFGGVAMDIDRDLVVTLSKTNDANAVVNDGVLMGMLGSELEASMPARFYHRAGDTSAFWLATSGALASTQSFGGTTVALTNANFPQVASHLAYSNSDLQDVQDGLNAGLTVMAPERLVRDHNGARFLGYLQLDLQTGSGAYIIGGANGAQRLECLESSGSRASLASGLLVGGLFDVGESIVGHIIDPTGGPVSFVNRIAAILDLVRNLGNNLHMYDNAVGSLGDSVRPLMGLVILMAALSILKELIPLSAAGGVVAGAYLNMVSWTAFRMAAILINRIIEVEAAAQCIDFPDQCIQFPPGCLNLDLPE